MTESGTGKQPDREKKEEGERWSEQPKGKKATGLSVVSDSQPCKGHLVTKHTAGGLTLIRGTKLAYMFNFHFDLT